MTERQRSRILTSPRALGVLALLALAAVACSGDAETATGSATAGATLAAAPSTPASTPGPEAPPGPVATSEARATLAPVSPPVSTATVPPTIGVSPAPAPAAVDTAVIGEARPAPELADLVQPDGSAFDLASFRGSNVLVFFGYTHCPDVCPATIGELFGVFEEAPATQAVFVSVDPERDTPEFLEEWTTYLPENLHAVTGSPGAIRHAAENYGVKYARVETTSTAGYTMAHSADLYLIDKSGQLLLAYPFGTPAAEIVNDIATLDAG